MLLDEQQLEYRKFKQELQYKMNYGAYKQIAQKIDKHIQDIYEADESQKNRWIWELIQNAKDTPNQFNRLRIKIQIYQNQMKFMHNADPFTLDDLVGLVQQLSSKSDKNDQKTQTTGKYGTGFITTHMLSRIISVQGYFRFKLRDNIPRTNRFNILLDRSYSDRDKQLVQKVAKSMQQLKRLEQSIGQIAKSRKQQQFDTIFTYKNLDGPALGYIDNGIEDLLRSINYTLLFNPKIFKIEIIDYRKNQKIFIERADQFIIDGIKISKTKIVQKNKTQEKYLAYTTNQKLHSVIAVPVKVQANHIEILQIQHHIPKIFKEFPLIGTEDWGYNYVITCKLFYPNEKRSALRLKLIDTRQDKKVVQNRSLLKKIVLDVQQFFTLLSKKIKKGLEKLAISKLVCPAQYREFVQKQVFKKFRDFIEKINIVKLSNGKLVSLSQIYFPIIVKEKVEESYKFSLETYREFNFLLKQFKIDEDIYKILYQILTVQISSWKNIKFRDLKFYFDELQNLGPSGLKNLINKDDYFEQKMIQIYKFIDKWYNQYMEPKEKTILITNNIITEVVAYEPKIVLNQNGQFCKVSDLRMQQELPQIFIRYAKRLSIDIKAELINNKIKDLFKISKRYNSEYCSKQLQKRFHTQISKNHLKTEQLIILFNYICTFQKNYNFHDKYIKQNYQLRKNIYQTFTKLIIFSKEQQYFINQKIEFDYKPFVLKLISEIVHIINQGFLSNLFELTDLSKILILKGQKSDIIKWWNELQELIVKSMRIYTNLSFNLTPFDLNDFILSSNMNYKQKFMSNSSLFYHKYKLNQNQRDILNEVRILLTNRNFLYNIYDIVQNIILHHQVSYQLFNFNSKVNNIKSINYKTLFDPVIQLFKSSNKNLLNPEIQQSFTFNVMQQKENQFIIKKILKFLNQIVTKSKDPNLDVDQLSEINDKLEVLKPINNYKLEVYLIRHNIQCQKKDYIHNMLSDDQQLKAFEYLIKEFKNLNELKIFVENSKKPKGLVNKLFK